MQVASAHWTRPDLVLGRRRAAAPHGRAGAAEALVVAALPDLGALVDVLRHRTGAADQWVRRIFAQFADGAQLDLAVVAQAEMEERRRGGGARTSSRCTRHPLRRAPRHLPPGPRPAGARPAASLPPPTRSAVTRSGSGPSWDGAR
jgi:hypothetical protein